MTVREFLMLILKAEVPLDAILYVGKGMGPAMHVDATLDPDKARLYLVITP